MIIAKGFTPEGKQVLAVGITDTDVAELLRGLDVIAELWADVGRADVLALHHGSDDDAIVAALTERGIIHEGSVRLPDEP